MLTSDQQPLEAAIHSIYGFIRRTAAVAGDEVSWETIDYENKPQREISVFNGVGGIPFFLTDYHRQFYSPEALALGQGAITWCSRFPGKHYRRGLHFGQTGVAMAALHRAKAVGGNDVPEICRANARILLSDPPGPITDLVGGEASNGLYLLRLWEHTRDAAYLRGAERCATWLASQMIRDERGTYCHIDPLGKLGFKPNLYLGVAHGIAGVAHFLTLLAEQTKAERWANLARELFATIARHAHPARGGLNWPVYVGQEELVRCQWSHGAAGIGLTFLNAHRLWGDDTYLDLAKQAAEATFGYGDFRQSYTFCTGLAGSGELFLETYLTTRDPVWRERAHDFARQCIAYREQTAAGDAWPTDGKGLHSADFVYGAAGVGHFLLRVLAEGKFPMPLM